MIRDPALGFVALAVGLGALAVLDWHESAGLERETWTKALLVPEGEPLWDGAMPVRAARIPLSNFPSIERAKSDMQRAGADAMIEEFGLEKTERIIAIDTPDSTFVELLEWGSLPTRGEPEVLAGVMTRLNDFEIGETSFRVVGGLKRTAGGLHFSYVLPRDANAAYIDETWTSGWLDQDGITKFSELEPEDDALEEMPVVGGMIPIERWRSIAIVVALILVAIGGALVQLRLFARLQGRKAGVLSSGFAAIAQARAGLVLLHLLLYGVVFGAMFLAIGKPVIHLYLAEIVAREFTEGGLKHVGNAYFSGNIPLAALMTFGNNFVLQTVAFTVLPSLLIPFWGVFKSAISFGVAGLALAPIWAGNASRFVYHSITMTLELEAYVLATYGVCLFAVAVIHSVFRDDAKTSIFQSLKIAGSLTVLSGLMLAVAAVYEAVTLIMLG